MDIDLTIHGLLRRRSEIAGSIAHLEAQVTSLRDDLLHLDASLRIMGYDGNQARLPVRKTCTSGLFHRKELPRLVLALLRDAAGGMQSSELAVAISRNKGWETDDKRFQTALTDKVSRVMHKLKLRGHASVSNHEAGHVWRLERHSK